MRPNLTPQCQNNLFVDRRLKGHLKWMKLIIFRNTGDSALRSFNLHSFPLTKYCIWRRMVTPYLLFSNGFCAVTIMLILDFRLDKKWYQGKVQHVLMANLIRPLVSVGALGAQHPQISREIHPDFFILSKNRVFCRKNQKSAPTVLKT